MLESEEKMQRLVCVLIILCLMLSGCTKLAYVQVRLVVHAIGIDIDENTGGYKVSYQVFSPDKTSASSPTDAGSTNVSTLVMTGETLYEAERNLELQTGREAFFGSTELIVIGKTMTGHSLSELMGYFHGSADIYMGTDVVFSSSNAVDVLSANLSKSNISAQVLRESVNAASEEGATASARIIEISNAIAERGGALVVPVVTVSMGESKGDTSNLSNTLYGVYSSLLVKNGYPEAVIDRECSKGIRLLNASAGSIGFNVTVGEDIATVSVDKLKIKRGIEIFDGYPIISVSITGVMEINENPNGMLEEVIRQLAQQKMFELCELAYSEAIVDHGADVFDIGRLLRKYESKYYAKTEEMFDDIVKNTLFDVEIELKTC